MGNGMDSAFIATTISILLLLTSCTGSGRGTSQCATELTYVTNRFTSGEQAIKHASEYRANLLMGSNEFTVEAIVDTASADLIVNEKYFDYGSETATGSKPFVFAHGGNKSLALNTKDVTSIACASDMSLRFAVTAKEPATSNYLGLAFSDPQRFPHEGKSVPFFDQLVRNEGFKDVFSLALCGQRGNSRVLLGGVDKNMVKLIGNFIPIIEKTAYVVPALSLKLADTKTMIADFPRYNAQDGTGIRTIIDSATSFLLLPTEMATKLSHKIESEAEILGLLDSFPRGFFRTERSNSTKVIRFFNHTQIRQFPSLEIIFLGSDGKDKALELSPLHYFKEMDTRDPMLRTFAIRETSGDVVLGQPFLENHYTYFDRKNKRIGFGDIDIACAE
jgi:hypothetical protein